MVLMNFSRLKLALHIFFILLPSLLLGENKTSIALPQFNNPIILDGSLDEAEWDKAVKIRDFYTFQPVDGQPAGERTAAMFGYDDNNLYLALICFYDQPDKIRASICKRDDIFEDDFIIFYLDTFNDGKSAYQFAFNPFGIQADGIFTENVGEDFKPDFLFESQGRYFAQGYIIEAAIPFKSLRFDHSKTDAWGAAILRRTQYLNHDVVWPAISLNSTQFVGQFAEVTNLLNISSGNRFEILPELSGLQTGKLNSTKNKFEEGPVKGEIGLNFKMGLSSGLTLDITANPDFSQIEADANKIDVNRRFPLYYDEKRPFFLEGTDIFQTPIEVVYTRQMVNPLTGIKLSGRSGPYSIGILSEVDEYEGSSEYLESKYLTYSLFKEFEDKKTFNNILRIKRNILENSFIGMIATDREFGRSFNRVAGIDGSFSFLNNYHISAQALYSKSRTIEDEEKEDPAFLANFYYGTRDLKIQAYYQDLDTNFVAENGFIRRTDFREAGLRSWYDFKSAKRMLQNFQPRVDYYKMYDHSGRLIEEQMNPSLNLTFQNKTDLYLNYFYQLEDYLGKTFYKSSYSIYLINSYISWLYGNIFWYSGDEIFYSAPYASLVPESGTTDYLSSDLTLKLGKTFTTSFSMANYAFETLRYDFNYRLVQNIYRIRSTWQLSRSLSLRLIYQMIDNKESPGLINPLFGTTDDTDLNFLLSWQPSPGTVFFFGVNDYKMYDPAYSNGWLLKHYRRQERGFFAKFSYLFRF